MTNVGKHRARDTLVDWPALCFSLQLTCKILFRQWYWRIDLHWLGWWQWWWWWWWWWRWCWWLWWSMCFLPKGSYLQLLNTQIAFVSTHDSPGGRFQKRQARVAVSPDTEGGKLGWVGLTKSKPEIFVKANMRNLKEHILLTFRVIVVVLDDC